MSILDITTFNKTSGKATSFDELEATSNSNKSVLAQRILYAPRSVPFAFSRTFSAVLSKISHDGKMSKKFIQLRKHQKQKILLAHSFGGLSPPIMPRIADGANFGEHR